MMSSIILVCLTENESLCLDAKSTLKQFFSTLQIINILIIYFHQCQKKSVHIRASTLININAYLIANS